MVEIVKADYGNPVHAAGLVEVLNAYAMDVAGGGQALTAYTRENLVSALAARQGAFSVLAFVAGPFGHQQAVGLVNCLEGFSTFACKPLVNVHDVAVLPAFRGQGIAQKMLALVEKMARQSGACKLTLEVLSGNQKAAALYEHIGFESYRLNPEMGDARFMHKKL
jgi:ribosomal protein S18 acetylase RimI-like enzyme